MGSEMCIRDRPSIIARVSIFQAWVVVQWCCRFNDSHQWDFPPPILTNLVVGCSVRGISFLLWIFLNCEFFLSPFPALNQTYKLDLGIIPSVSPVLGTFCYQIGFAFRFQCLRSPLFAATLYWNPPWTFTMRQEYRAVRTNDQQSSKLSGALHLFLLRRASPNDVIMTSFV